MMQSKNAVDGRPAQLAILHKVLASVDAGLEIRPMAIFNNLPTVCQDRLRGAKSQSKIANWLTKTFKHVAFGLFSLKAFGKILKKWGPGNSSQNKVPLVVDGW
jgi:hypothetical protein